MTADYIFETSWEICNKVGGIYTVLSTKAATVVNQYKDNYICIGPDLSKEHNEDFIEDPNLYRNWREVAQREGLKIRIGRWNICGTPVVVLVDFTSFLKEERHSHTVLAQLPVRLHFRPVGLHRACPFRLCSWQGG